MRKIPRSVGVHDGTFHADEVSACALLILFNCVDKDKIVRTRAPKKLAECEYVCDVGGIYNPDKKLFDHHQQDYRGDLSSAGMILKYLKDQRIIGEDEYDFFNNSMIKGVDAHDNGRSLQEPGVCSFSHVIANFNPISQEAEEGEYDEAFKGALDFTFGHLSRMHERFRYTVACRQIVKEQMEKHHLCLFFDRPLPWLESFFSLNGREHSALFVIMPAGKYWKLRAIPPDYENRMKVRVPLPEEWAGLLEEDLKKITGISGAVFCHKGRFTSVWETREDAIKALKMILKKNSIPYEERL